MTDELTKMLSVPAQTAAPRLLGCILQHEVGGQILSGQIVETEAYDQTDAASHSYRGQTPRTAVMFGPPGFLYVYFTYGMHYCCNVVCGPPGTGSAVLIRALAPVKGITVDQKTNGPAKLCRVLQIDKQLNGQDLRKSPLRLLIKTSVDQTDIIQSPRIGISRERDKPWRFYIRDNAYVSKM